MTEDPILTEHEKRDINFRLVIIGAGALLGLIVLSLLAVRLLMALLGANGSQAVNGVPEITLPEPQLQVSPAQDWAAMKATQESILNSYAWVDRESGIARIPIERAMEVLVTQYAASPTPTAEPAGGVDEQE